jgi:hypothetical protein
MKYRGGWRGGNVIVDFRLGRPERRPSEKVPMKDDQLAKELHEFKRRRETPLPLIEMFDALLSLPRTERKTEAQAIRRDHGYGIETVGAQGRLIATRGWRRRAALY